MKLCVVGMRSAILGNDLKSHSSVDRLICTDGNLADCSVMSIKCWSGVSLDGIYNPHSTTYAFSTNDPIAQESSVLKVKLHIPGFFMKYLTNIQISNCCHSMIKWLWYTVIAQDKNYADT